MAGKNYLAVAEEAIFGTAPSSGWAGVEVTDLGSHTPIVTTFQPETMRKGQQGRTVAGRRTSARGGTGTAKPVLATRGMLPFLAATFGTPVSTELVSGVYQHVYTTSSALSPVSLAVQIGREFKGGGQDLDTFTGGQVSEARFTQGLSATSSGTSSEGGAMAEFDLNYAGFLPLTAEVNPVYPDGASFTGGDWTAKLGPAGGVLSDECLNEFGLTIPTGADFEDRCIQNFRDKAGRGALPAPSMQLGWSYKDRTYYNAWIAGTIFSFEAEYKIVAINLGGGYSPSVKIEVPAIAFSGETPQESATETTKQALPADVLWDEDAPMVTVTVVTDEVGGYVEES